MEKISITIDVTKVDKSRISERRYTDSQGHEVIARDLKLDLVPLREPKKIKEGDGWEMWKTHFVAIQQTKDERESKAKSKIVGDGIAFRDKKAAKPDGVEYPAEDINPEDIPF